MPPLPDIAGVVRLELQFSNVGGDLDVKNRSFWEYSGGPATDAQIVTWLDAVSGGFTGHCVGLMGDQWELIGLEGTDLSSPTAAAGAIAASATGDRAGGALPVGTATLVNYLVARRYRGGKPRGYLPFGLDSDLSSPRVWSSAFLAAVLSDWGSFLGVIEAAAIAGGANNQQVNISYYSGFTAVENPLTGRYRNVPKLRVAPVTDIVTGFSVNPILGSQRKRFQR